MVILLRWLLEPFSRAKRLKSIVVFYRFAKCRTNFNVFYKFFQFLVTHGPDAVGVGQWGSMTALSLIMAFPIIIARSWMCTSL